MIKLFRKIRQQLLSSGQMKKYFLYAIGEIFLVVIGVLIALQINNWNEERKDRKKETFFLKDIKDDLEQDVIELDRIIQVNRKRLSFYQLIDPNFNLKERHKITVTDTTLIFHRLFNRGRSFRPSKGSYSSLISDGESKLITNRDLFHKIQMIYDVEYSHIASIYETLKDVEVSLKKKRTYEMKYHPYKNISEITDKKLLADFEYLHKQIRFYTSLLWDHRERITETLQLIEEELKN